ncbi:indolin-2-one monooxygenase [Dichanthelium oligosanthes]|uniref:Indolin-2-one monooxygenase n=1 Tax=Dichanthelium oligosanthes TaxID=888268 RepID=A0A1E5V874_9POAL|nr:indolin-2-one monooxygenase [Dichanthelium oligosanthes]
MTRRRHHHSSDRRSNDSRLHLQVCPSSATCTSSAASRTSPSAAWPRSTPVAAAAVSCSSASAPSPTLSIVSSPRAAELILRTHDHFFASRPASTIAYAPYGENWRQLKKLVTTHLLTVKKVHSYCRARQQDQVHLVVAKIREAAASRKAVDISEIMNTFANDIACRAVSGNFFRVEGQNKRFGELDCTTSLLVGGFNLEDYFPGLVNSLGFLTSRFLSKRVDEAQKRWDELLEKIISDHEGRNIMHLHGGGAEQEGSDFIHLLLSVQQEYGITSDHIKAILMDLFTAGTGTASVVLELAMAERMRSPQHMTKLQAETVSLMDTKYPPGLEPSSTYGLLVEIIESWEKPEEFMPERFTEGGSAVAIDFKGNDFQFLPFGAGRRMCPGLNFGLATVEIMLANLLYCFDWGLPAGMEKEGINMTEVFGAVVHLKEKLLLVPKSAS